MVEELSSQLFLADSSFETAISPVACLAEEDEAEKHLDDEEAAVACLAEEDEAEEPLDDEEAVERFDDEEKVERFDEEEGVCLLKKFCTS